MTIRADIPLELNLLLAITIRALLLVIAFSCWRLQSELIRADIPPPSAAGNLLLSLLVAFSCWR